MAALPAAPPVPTPSGAALAHFMPAPTPIDLRGVHARAEVSIPIPAGFEPKRLILHLAAANSVALMPKRSVLRVLLGDSLVAQIPLDPKLPRIEASVELPVQRLSPGYHRLVFDAAQHYTVACEDPSAPELWTQIDTQRSWLELDGRWQDGPLSLAELDRLFDPRRWGSQPLTVVTVGPLTSDTIRLGAIASQAAAVQLRYRPLRVMHRSLELRPGALEALLQSAGPLGPIVLLGAPDAIGVVLGGALAGDSQLALLRHPARPEDPLLVVRGTVQEMERALQALAIPRMPLPDRSETGIDRVFPLPASVNLPANRPVRLSTLGWNEDLEVRGRFGGRAIEFNLPVDFYTPREDFLSLRLNLSYGSGLRKDSALNIAVNGRFAHAVPLHELHGARYDDYEVQIPVALLQPGFNRLELNASLIPAEGGQCVEQAVESMRLTVRADSTIQLPSHALVAAVPDLRLVGRGAYPYADARSVGLWLGDDDSETLGAAWTLLARLAQIRAKILAPLQVQVGQARPNSAEDWILVGTPKQFPAEILANAPLDPIKRISYSGLEPLLETPAPAWRKWLHWLALGVPTVPTRPDPVNMTLQGPTLGRQAALLQWLDGKGRLLTWLAADETMVLRERVSTLIEPAVWSRLAGDVMLWRDADAVYTDRVGAVGMRGSAGWSMRLSYLFSQKPVSWMGTALVILLLAWSSRMLLLRFKARKRPNLVEEGDPKP
ncbi:MAG: cellulose biosynthesis cyclic di-GMP-binding regulatory protein BcsB [Tepidimonas sp.]|uniref:cellulose biosynthesis cyclic di-GMP-binding regulatory protein BcsB n=1 Tax=Tepidimonas sp. TaxID=2002775 RepID=UPI00259D75EC|nr:cellulose biosynthesis cyclic di-GMP-binding regulatory protein BcsB [Tepidimonas sp.]MDM7456030.1 cellulose biosynthesis cyclic di-GMP-binding regulatory protein BcsB [Tepidimonas sp.]